MMKRIGNTLFRWDPLRKKYIKDSIPTKSIRYFKRKTSGLANTLFGSFYGGIGSITRIVNFHIDNANNQQAEWYVKDRRGTLDMVIAGCYRHGAPYEPIFMARGTFAVHFFGTAATGTYGLGFEGIVE